MLNGLPRILIIRFSAIGDVIRVIPALHALRDLYPNAQIDWAVEPKSADILEDHPALDRVILFDRHAGARAFFRFCRQVRAAHYDLILDFHGILKSGLAMGASRAPRRIAFARPRGQELSPLFATECVRLPADRMNRIEENLELVKVLGAKRLTLDVHIPVPEDVQDTVEDWIADKFHGGKRFIAVHAMVERPEKQWPLRHFAELCDLLLADGRFEVLLTWGPGQREIAAEVRRLSKGKPEIAPETPTLKHLAWLLSLCDCFIGGDTGPTHLASAMNTPVLALFGGTDPKRHCPLRLPSAVLYLGPEPPRRTVDRRDGAAHLARITPQMAYDAAIALIKGQTRL